jgi:hypothetical protein
MKNTQINDLLNKYWNAETSVTDENKLKSYFNSDNVASEHEQYAPLFQFFELEKGITADHLNLYSTKKLSKSAKIYQISKSWRSLAAVLVLVLASIVVIQSDLITSTQNKATVVNVEDPEQALEYTKMALAMVSKNYRKGTSELTAGMDNVNKINIIK